MAQDFWTSCAAGGEEGPGEPVNSITGLPLLPFDVDDFTTPLYMVTPLPGLHLKLSVNKIMESLQQHWGVEEVSSSLE